MSGVRRPGHRMLMALISHLEEDKSVFDDISVQGLFLAVACSICLVVLVVLCACKDGKTKSNGTSGHGETDKQDDVVAIDLTEMKSSHSGMTSVENGGSQSNRNSANMSKHSRQPSSASGNNVRPTSLRELPEPPITAHHSRNTSMSGVGVQVAAGSGMPACGEDETSEKRPVIHKDPANDGDGYDHLGTKPVPQPTDYDQLGPAVITPDDLDTPISEVSSGMDGHYSQPKERMYAVCKDVRSKPAPTYESTKEREETVLNHYSHVSEEDPYNQIDSGGSLRNSAIQRIRQNTSDPDDPYATVQGDSGGSYNDAMHAVGGTRTQSALSSSLTPAPEIDTGEDEYAVVQKGGGRTRFPPEGMGLNSEDEIAPYSIRPPEPPRLYEGYEDEDYLYEEGSDQTTNTREHKYSKVTARESLASMSARNALNPYEMMADIPENTYATVEGGSGDGVVQDVIMRNRMAGMTEDENRLSQNSDTYAEIAISGGGLTTSIISNTSTSSNANVVLATSSSSSGAPIPPSLDSLPQMSKSLTSSEGDRLSDRLSDRFLGSPDDRVLPGQFDSLDFSDNDGEDGYSTLTRADGTRSSLHSDLPHPVNSIDLDCHDNGQENSEDSANDPNYESVDELRAKVNLLKIKEEEMGQGLSSEPHVTVVDVSRKGLDLDGKQPRPENTSDGQNPRRRRPHHDYEEVDVSPPHSPQTPLLLLPESDVANAEAARERVLNGHTYEEVAQVQTKKSQAKKTNTSEGRKKSGSGEEKDKKKSKEEKKKSKSEEKRKNSESSRTNTWDGSKKSHSWEANRTRL